MSDEILSKKKRVEILGVPIDPLSSDETVNLVEEYINAGKPLHLMGVNADKINQCKKNVRLDNIVKSCGIINADGVSLVMAGKFLGKHLPERVAGIDLMQDLVERSEEKGYKVYFFGAKEEIVRETSEKLKLKFPRLNVTGIRNGYFKEEELASISQDIKDKNPDIVFVGITSPLKEYVVDFFQNEGHNRVFMGVGGSFDVISGKLKRAPIWIQKLNLEWLYRISQEPRRLFKRYLVGNFIFIKNIVIEKIEGASK